MNSRRSDFRNFQRSYLSTPSTGSSIFPIFSPRIFPVYKRFELATLSNSHHARIRLRIGFHRNARVAGGRRCIGRKRAGMQPPCFNIFSRIEVVRISRMAPSMNMILDIRSKANPTFSPILSTTDGIWFFLSRNTIVPWKRKFHLSCTSIPVATQNP